MTTREGAKLTEAHRVAQLRNAGEAVRMSRAAWGLLDLRDIDASTERWLRAMLPVLRRYNKKSRDLAEAYLKAFKRAETGGKIKVIPGGLIDEIAAVTSLEAMGPIAVKQGLSMGRAPEEAGRVAFRRLSGSVQRQVSQGGRETVDLSVSRDGDALGFRRVTGPNPCAFCAMLASRGPVYRSRDIALSSGQGGRVRGNRTMGSRYHDHCGCTVEPSYGDWTPTADEERWDRIYTEASVSGDMRATLRNMRRLMNE